MRKIKANLKMMLMVFKYSPLFAVTSIILVAVDVLSTLVDIYILEEVVSLVTLGKTFSEVLGFIIVIISVKIVLAIYTSLYYGHIRTKGRNEWVKKIQTIIYSKAMKIDISYFDDPKLYDKFSRALKQSDIKTIDCFESFVSLACTFCSVVTLVIYIASSVPILFIITLLTSIVTLTCYNKLNKLRYAVYKEVEVNERQNSYINRTFYLEKNAYDLKTTNIASLLLEKKNEVYKDYDLKYRECEKKQRKYRVIEDVIYQIVTNFITYGYLMFELYNGTIGLDEFTALSASIYKFINRFYNFSRNITNLSDKFLYIEDFLWLMSYEPNLEEYHKVNKKFEFEAIKFKDVTFKYANKEKYALNNLNIEIKKGEKIAIIGYNGAGKTTLTKLLLKLYDPENGEIYINNINYQNLTSYDIRSKTSIILQNFQIYCATVLENVLMREKQTEDDEKIVTEALKKVGLYNKISSLPQGINTVLTKEFSNEGIELSGGERQKLAIARVFASNAKLVILDEPTSALDPFAEKEINDDIIRMGNDKTIIIISHRLSTIVNVDKIYVMKEGQIIEQGTHNQLMNNKNVYYEMFTAQAELYNEDKN